MIYGITNKSAYSALLRRARFFCLFVWMFSVYTLQAQGFPETEIRLSRQSNTLYNILNQLSRQTGYFFIYDSQVVDSDKQIRIGSTRKDLREFLVEILEDPGLAFKVIDQHILIYRPATEELTHTQEEPVLKAPREYITLEGRVIDLQTGTPLPFAAISIAQKRAGVPANAEGVFRMRIPIAYENDTIKFSHLGYKPRQLSVKLLEQGFFDVTLEMAYISLQEIVITYFDPSEILFKALSAKEYNYPDKAVNYLSFYREGILSENQLMNYSEAIIREYAPPWNSLQSNQAVVYKSRNISNSDRNDTLIFKLKAGLQSAIDLDLIRNTPDFLDPEFMNDYNYTAAGLVLTHNNLTYVIDFEQKSHISEPLHQGSIFIDKNTFAIVGIEFKINPRNIRRIQSRFIPRQSPTHVTQILSAEYIVNYQPWGDRYHVSHIRGEIKLRARQRSRLFGREYRVFFERAVMQTETENVNRFRRRDTFRTHTIFADQDFVYDPEFWGDYNFITPEKEIDEALQRINGIIESKVFD